MKHFDLRRTPRRESSLSFCLLGARLWRVALPRPIYCFSRKSRTSSGRSANHPAGRIGATRVAASRLERALSGSRLRPVRELGPGERSRRPAAYRAPVKKSRWQVSRCRKRRRCGVSDLCRFLRPFGAQFNSHHAFFNLAQLLMYPVDARSEPMSRAFQPMFPKVAHRHAADRSLPEEISAQKIMTGWSILRSRSETLRNLISTKAGGHYRVVVDADPATTIWKRLRPCCARSWPPRPTGWTIVPSTAICFSITFPQDRRAAAWSIPIQRRSRQRRSVVAGSGGAGFGDGA